MKESLRVYPEIADAYFLYQTCRNQEIYEYEFTRGGHGMRILLPYTKGLSVLPSAGGVLDQPERLMAYFEEFLAGDEQAFHVRLERKQ